MLAEKIGAVQRLLQKRVIRSLQARKARPINQLKALKVVVDEGICTQAALAQRLVVDPPAASRLVDKLEKDGLITRCAGENRRCVGLKVTAAGRKELADLKRELKALNAELGRHLSGREATSLLSLLTKLQTALEEPG